MNREQMDQQDQFKAIVNTMHRLQDEIDGLKRQNKQLQAQIKDLEIEIEEIRAQIHQSS